MRALSYPHPGESRAVVAPGPIAAQVAGQKPATASGPCPCQRQQATQSQQAARFQPGPPATPQNHNALQNLLPRPTRWPPARQEQTRMHRQALWCAAAGPARAAWRSRLSVWLQNHALQSPRRQRSGAQPAGRPDSRTFRPGPVSASSPGYPIQAIRAARHACLTAQTAF